MRWKEVRTPNAISKSVEWSNDPHQFASSGKGHYCQEMEPGGGGGSGLEWILVRIKTFICLLSEKRSALQKTCIL